MSKTLLEIGEYINPKVKELAFNDLFHFILDLIFDGTRLANDKEVSEILYEAIEYGGLYIPEGINTSKFTVQSLLLIVDSNYKPTYTKEKIAKELKIHEQTLNKWLEVFDKDLFLELFNKRKLTYSNLYMIMNSLGFTESEEILNRNDLSRKCKLKSSELKKNLSDELLEQYNKFIKYPPIFSNQVLAFFEEDLIWLMLNKSFAFIDFITNYLFALAFFVLHL